MSDLGQPLADQYPDLIHARSKGKIAWDVVGDEKWIADEFIPTVGKRGAAIIDARGASTRRLGRERRDRPRPRLGARHARRRLGLDGASPPTAPTTSTRGSSRGFPCTCSGGEYKIVEGLEIDDFSRERIDATVAELNEERDAVEELGLI